MIWKERSTCHVSSHNVNRPRGTNTPQHLHDSVAISRVRLCYASCFSGYLSQCSDPILALRTQTAATFFFSLDTAANLQITRCFYKLAKNKMSENYLGVSESFFWLSVEKLTEGEFRKFFH